MAVGEIGRLGPLIFFGRVMHARLRPKRNAFSYGVFFVRFPLSSLDRLAGPLFSVDRFNLLSFHRRDHGARDGRDLESWVRALLATEGIRSVDGEIWLQAFPRVLGFVFNPVSFWLCRDKAGALRAVLCEVNNTFGESHCYLVHHDDRREIRPDDWLDGRKAFHVSPFLPIEGGYRFRFRFDRQFARVEVNYHDAAGLLLTTSVGGRREPLGNGTIRRHFLSRPAMTLAVIFRIHLQALHLWRKRARFYSKPAPPAELVTR